MKRVGAHVSTTGGVENAPLNAAETEVEKTYAERERWVTQSMRTVEEPYLRIAAVLIGRED